jgi:hypothetical protein
VSHPDDTVKRYYLGSVFFYDFHMDGYGIVVENVIELPQFNTIFSRILAYSQDFITLDMDLTIK